jgi:hypothetical protein
MTRAVFERTDVIPLVVEDFRGLGHEGASLGRLHPPRSPRRIQLARYRAEHPTSKELAPVV